jgi:DNA helicase-2/ATP-dependent DNA helicase PcrA
MQFSDLTEEQRAAVLHDGNLRLIACPGSGKTACIAFRVGYWINQGLDPRKTLCITFTRKAAKEMKQRIKKVLGESAKGVQAATFHSFFLSFLIRYSKMKDHESPFTIIDDVTSRKIIKIPISPSTAGGARTHRSS